MCNIRLETERLIVRPYEEKDLPEYHKLFSNKENMYYVDDLIMNTVEESQESLKEAIEKMKTGKVRRFCIALKENDKLIGGTGYDIIKETPIGKIGGMGWFIMPEYQNKGYITEAVKKVLEFAFMQDNCVRVETGCYKDNIPSEKVMSSVSDRVYTPNPDNVKIYDKLYAEYKILHDYFGRGANDVMKRLKEVKANV